MSQDDFLDDRRRASEDDYFRKKDRELIEKMRQAAAADRAKTELSTRTGLSDPALIAELGALGFTPDTISVLPLVPVVQMAWAEGGITPAERDMLIRLARGRGIAAGGAADQQLSDWMARRPSDDVFARAMRLIRAMLDTGTTVDGSLNADDVISTARASQRRPAVSSASAKSRPRSAKRWGRSYRRSRRAESGAGTVSTRQPCCALDVLARRSTVTSDSGRTPHSTSRQP